MTLHALIVVVTGLFYMGAGAVLAETARALGSSYHTRHTPHPVWRALGWFGAAVLVWWAATLLFPGATAQPDRLALPGLLVAMVALGVNLSLLDWVMRDRSPPPWTARLLSMAAREGVTDPVLAEMAFALPAEPHGRPAPPRPATEREPCRWVRLSVMIGAGLLIVLIAVIVALSSAAA